MNLDIKGVIISNDEGWIYDLFGIENTSPAKIVNALREANGEDVDIDINSYGGDVFAGSEIYTAIRGYSGNVNIHIVGVAASAASVIACAAHSDISPTAQMMVHNVSIARACGDYHDMDKASEMLQQANRALAAAYTEKSGMTEKEVLDMMDVETWLTADDAVAYKLVDEIAEAKNTNQGATVIGDRLAASASGMLPGAVIDKMQAKRQSLIDYFN